MNIPKALRRAADSEVGAAMIAGVTLAAAGAALASPEARKLREKAQKFAVLAAHALSATAQGAANSVSEFFGEEEPLKTKRETTAGATAH